MSSNDTAKLSRIVYVGSMDPQSNSYRRFATLRSMGYDMIGVDIDKPIYASISSSVHYRFNVGPGIWKLSRLTMKAVEQHRPDILWFDNKVFVRTTDLRKLKAAFPSMKLVNLITDDVTGHARSGWRLTLKSAPLMDCHFVQRQLNVDELKYFGARNSHICYRSFDPAFHRKLNWSQGEKAAYACAVGFIGTWEASREEFVAFLIQSGIPVRVTGNDWPKGKYWSIIKDYYTGPSVYGEEYVKTINGMDIALHFLRHASRDEQDSRTYEIPACGTFMLAERSALHEQLFEEGREAAFFSDKDEMLEKVRYYLSHSAEREAMALAGMERCHRSGYTHESRLREVMKIVSQC